MEKDTEWTSEVKCIMYTARKKAEQKGVDFEGVVLVDHTAGYDLVTFGNNPKNKIDQIVIGARVMGFPKELFFDSQPNFILHKSNPTETLVK